MKKFLIVTSFSFTALILLFDLFSCFDMAPQISNSVAIQLFIMSVTISFLMLCSEVIEERFDLSSILMDTVVRILICYLVAFFEGAAFDMFSLSLHSFLYITPILIPVFILTYGASYLLCREWADAINQAIQKNR